MRLLLCINRDFLSNWALNHLRPALVKHEFAIVLSHGIGKQSSPKALEIVKWGQEEKELFETGLCRLLAHRTNLTDQFGSFEQFARMSQCFGVVQFKNINEDDGLLYVKDIHPDVIISIRFGQIFKPTLISIPALGVINLHSGVLPNYRGILATFWAMLHDENDIGCTLHYVLDSTIDTGSVISMYTRPVRRDKSLLWNVASLYPGGVALIVDALEKLAAGTKLVATSQTTNGQYFSYPSQEFLNQFINRGYTLYSRADYSELFARYGISTSDFDSL